MLVSSHPSPTPTLVRAIGRTGEGHQLDRSLMAAFGHGMFLVHSGRDSFYAPVLSDGRYRYDPGCMTACDARARQVEEYLSGQITGAAAYEWAEGGQVLVLDNHRVLHARAAVNEGDAGRELTRVAFRPKAER